MVHDELTVKSLALEVSFCRGDARDPNFDKWAKGRENFTLPGRLSSQSARPRASAGPTKVGPFARPQVKTGPPSIYPPN